VNATVRYVFFAVPLRLIFALTVAVLLNTNAAWFISTAPLITHHQSSGKCRRGRDVASDIRRGWPGQYRDGDRYCWFGDPKYALEALVSLAVWQLALLCLSFWPGCARYPTNSMKPLPSTAQGLHKL